MVGGFGEFIEKQFETARDLAARGVAVWCLDWRGQGGSIRPRRMPTRPRARKFDRDAEDLAAFASAKLTGGLPRLLVAHSMGGAIALLCLRRHPKLFAAAVLSSPMVGLRTGKLPPTLIRCITRRRVPPGSALALSPAPANGGRTASRRPRRAASRTDAERCRLRHAWFSAEPALRLDEATYGWVDSALGLVARISKPEFLRAIKTPILMGRPGREVVVSPKAQRRAAGLLPNCTLVELRESKHDPFLERDAIRDYWLSCLDRFIAERVVERHRIEARCCARAGGHAAGAAHAGDRRVAVDPNKPPWNAVAKVQTNTAARCTGVLIAPAVVLTAAHCLYNRLTRPAVAAGVAARAVRLRARRLSLAPAGDAVTVGAGFDGGKRRAANRGLGAARTRRSRCRWRRCRCSTGPSTPGMPVVLGRLQPGPGAAVDGRYRLPCAADRRRFRDARLRRDARHQRRRRY